MAVTRKNNVIVSATNGDTVTGPLSIESIKVVAGGATASCQLSVGGVTIYDSGNISTNLASIADEAEIYISGGDTLTVALSGTGAKVYLYLE